MAVEFKVEYVDADNARIRAFDTGSLIDEVRVRTAQAEALAEATLAARDAFRGAQDDGLIEGARVLVGNDPVVRREFYGQEGTINRESWAGDSSMKIILFDNDQEQVVRNEYLTVMDRMPVLVSGPDAEDTDADAAQEQALFRRLAEEGVRVTVAADARAFLKDDEDEPTGRVYFTGEVEATIMERPPHDNMYCMERNFYVENDTGLGQVVAIRNTEPLDEYREVISDLTRSVGAEFAERRGIVPGATVSVPGLEGILFGTGTVTDVADGAATVNLAGVMEREYPVFVLNTADDDG